MSVDVKLGGNTITGVSSVKLESATTPGTYETFNLAGSNPKADVVVDTAHSSIVIPDNLTVEIVKV
jgi:hypothetical protein